MNMLENLETLMMLHKHGSMARTSSVLRVGQSAVSKRISALENAYGLKLIEKVGRNVALTEEGRRLLEQVSPLLAQIREALHPQKSTSPKKLIIGVSESILSSWGARRLEEIFKKLDIKAEYHCHRSPLVLEKVEAGIYDLGICAGIMSNPRSIFSEEIAKEELVLIAKDREQLTSRRGERDILSIERSSATWKCIQERVAMAKLNPVREVESFFSIAQLAMAGYGVGLVPVGVARSLGVEGTSLLSLRPKIFRGIQIVYKKSKLERSYFEELLEELRKVKLS